MAERRVEALRAAKFDTAKYATIDTIAELKRWIERAHDAGMLALKTETASLDPMQTALCGIALAVATERSRLFTARPSRGERAEKREGLFAAKLCEGQIAEREAFAALKDVAPRR